LTAAELGDNLTVKEITLKWFVCPRPTTSVNTISISVVLMPELRGGDRLDDFTPFRNWPETLRKLSFTLHVSREDTSNDSGECATTDPSGGNDTDLDTIPNLEFYLKMSTIKESFWMSIFKDISITPRNALSLSKFVNKKDISFHSIPIMKNIKEFYTSIGTKHQIYFPTSRDYSFDNELTLPPYFQTELEVIEVSRTHGDYVIIPLKAQDTPDSWLKFSINSYPSLINKNQIFIAHNLDDEIYQDPMTTHQRSPTVAVCKYVFPPANTSSTQPIVDSFSVVAYNPNTGKHSRPLWVTIIITNEPPVHNETDDNNLKAEERMQKDKKEYDTRFHKENEFLLKNYYGQALDFPFTLAGLAITSDNEKFMKSYLDNPTTNLLDLYDTPKWNFYLVRYCQEKLKSTTPIPVNQGSNTIPNLDGEIDFHDVADELTAEYKDLARNTGLILDFEIPIDRIGTNNRFKWQSPEELQGTQSTVFKELKLTSNFRELFGCRNDESDNCYKVCEIPIWTKYILEYDTDTFSKKRFLAYSPDKSDGWNLFNEDRHMVITLDIIGTANKVSDFSSNISNTILHDSNNIESAISDPKPFSMPFLRSAGFSIIDSKIVPTLTDNLTDMNKIYERFATFNDVHLDANDLFAGYRVDVKDNIDQIWRSLCYRRGRYTFKHQEGDTPSKLSIADEGYITLAPSSAGEDSDIRIVPESMFKWNGWGLCAEPFGQTITYEEGDGDEGEEGASGMNKLTDPHEHPLPSDDRFRYPIWVTFEYSRRGTDNQPDLPSLPKLRFGRKYWFRMRTVDLAGNGLHVDEETPMQSPELKDSFIFPIEGVRFLRYEPISSPVVVLRNSIDYPGESVDELVIRSFRGTDEVRPTERHIAPPKASLDMVEKHGIFDRFRGASIGDIYNKIKERDGSFTKDYYDVSQLELPYLHDPLVRGVCLRNLPFSNTGDEGYMIEFPVHENWPWHERLPFRIVLCDFRYQLPEDSCDECKKNNESCYDKNNNTFYIRMKPASTAQVKISCILEKNKENELAIYDWIEPTIEDRRNHRAFQSNVETGKHWMMTPFHNLNLTYAVPEPQLHFVIRSTPSNRGLYVDHNERERVGTTFAILRGENIPVHGTSTQKIMILATWFENNYDITSELKQRSIKPDPVCIEDSRFEILVDSKDSQLNFAYKHEFPDTKYREITYTAHAIPRFTDKYKEGETAELVSEPVTLKVLSTARPLSPKVSHIVPTIRRNERYIEENNTITLIQESLGGGLRIYLEPPFETSGLGEMLGIVLWKYVPDGNEVSSPDYKKLESLITKWALDPISSSKKLPEGYLLPSKSHFKGYSYPPDEPFMEEKFSTEELINSGNEDLLLSVVGYDVEYDEDQGLFYCDIHMDPGFSYMPFVRLSLSNFQKNSIGSAIVDPRLDCHLSRIVIADFVQILPNRYASVLFGRNEGIDTEPVGDNVTVSISGFTDYEKVTIDNQIRMKAAVEVSVNTDEESWFTWGPDENLDMIFNGEGKTPTVWKKDIPLPYERSRCRILIKEFELFCKQGDAQCNCSEEQKQEKMIRSFHIKLR